MQLGACNMERRSLLHSYGTQSRKYKIGMLTAGKLEHN